MIRNLSGRRAFQRLRSTGIRSGKGPVRVVYLRTQDESVRVGVAIPRSVGGAVVRNRIRRRIKAVLREVSEIQPGLPPGGDYLIRVTAPLEAVSHDDLSHMLEQLLFQGGRP